MIIPSIGIGPLGASEWNVGGVSGLGSSAAGVGSVTGVTANTTNPAHGTFGSALTNAIGGLDNTQNIAATDSQKLATGQLSNPTTAVTAVENATLSMDYASQIRNQIDSAATTLFSTQV